MRSAYHDGELAMQARAGTQHEARRIGRSIRADMPEPVRDFLRRQRMAVVGSVAADGRVWASLLVGASGFLEPRDATSLQIAAEPAAADPLAENLRPGASLGLLVIDLAARRRMRVNGRVAAQPEDGILVRVEQVFANCPKYIQARVLEDGSAALPGTRHVRRDGSLNDEQISWVARADTFFIASQHTNGGADASHRGGFPGFVRVLSPRRLIWPDYSGNGMFQTLGNLLANPEAGLLFVDFDRGRTLQITGEASVSENATRISDFPGAERVVKFEVERVVEIIWEKAFRWRFLSYSPFNPG